MSDITSTTQSSSLCTPLLPVRPETAPAAFLASDAKPTLALATPSTAAEISGSEKPLALPTASETVSLIYDSANTAISTILNPCSHSIDPVSWQCWQIRQFQHSSGLANVSHIAPHLTPLTFLHFIQPFCKRTTYLCQIIIVR